ncbi:hypothetical protein D3C87_253050 [compost metagenome]
MTTSILLALSGGALIGLATALMLIFNGRVTGISGILNNFITSPRQEQGWRGFFLGGLILGGGGMAWLRPDFFANITGRSLTVLVIAGLLVGFGTVMGSGCTSGHGICGISRMSIRSMVATLVFMIFGILTATFFKGILGV